MLGSQPVRGGLLAKEPDSSVGGVPVGYYPEGIHMEEEKVEVKVQEEEVEDERDCEEWWRSKREQTITLAHDTWMK